MFMISAIIFLITTPPHPPYIPPPRPPLPSLEEHPEEDIFSKPSRGLIMVNKYCTVTMLPTIETCFICHFGTRSSDAKKIERQNP